MFNLDKTPKNDLRLARKVITNSGSTVFITGKYDKEKPYWAATQNLNYISDLTKKQKIENAFTILGSSDNVFELVRLGVPNIVATDINTFAKYIFYLKKAAIKTLDVKEYVSFILDPHSDAFFKREIFQNRVIYGFEADEEVYREFWCEMFRVYGKSDILNSFANPGFRNTNGKDRVNFSTYIQNRKYDQIRENISKTNIELHEKDALEVLKSLDGQVFDWIDITNILLFVLQFASQDDERAFRTYIAELESVIRKRLADNGIFVIDYMFKRTNPKGLLSDNPQDRRFLLGRIDEVYRIIFRTINEYFDISTLKYKSISNAANTPEDNKTPDQLVLARIKK